MILLSNNLRFQQITYKIILIFDVKIIEFLISRVKLILKYVCLTHREHVSR